MRHTLNAKYDDWENCIMQLRGSLMSQFYAGFAFESCKTWVLKAGGVLGSSVSIYPL